MKPGIPKRPPRKTELDVEEALLAILPLDGSAAPLKLLGKWLGLTQTSLRALVERLIKRELVVAVGRDAVARHATIVFELRDQAPFTWGENWYGQLGDGTTTSRTQPVQVNVAHVQAVANGLEHMLALRRDGAVFAWGRNLVGQIGDGTTQNRLSPVQLTGIDSVIAIAAGRSNSYAVRSDGQAWAWGLAAWGALGAGSATNTRVPIPIPGLTRVVALVAAGDTCHALKSDGTVWGWGGNYYVGGVVGGAQPAQTTPLQTAGLSDVVALSAGGTHTLALKSDGTVWGWGNNTYGELGDGTLVNKARPVQAIGLPRMIAIAAGEYHSVGIADDHTVWAWGQHHLSPFGNWVATPNQVPGLTGAVGIASGGHSLAFLADGTVWHWGGTFQPSGTPVQVSGLAGALGGDSSSGNVQDSSIVIVAARGTFTPNPLDFGTRAIGTQTTRQATLANTGSLPLTISGVNVAGNPIQTGDFTVGTWPTSLAPGASVQIDVTFTPSAAGARDEAMGARTSAGSLVARLLGTGQ